MRKTHEAQITEIARCLKSASHFVNNYVKIVDATEGEWVDFVLWDEQIEALNDMIKNQLVVILKARQLGMTWLVLSYALWKMIFRPAAIVLLFSKRDDEAVYLLDNRLKGMWKRIPNMLKNGIEIVKSNAHELVLSNGSEARAFPTTGGDSYTATLAIVDEADLVKNLDDLMKAVKPTIDGGGQMILLSRSDKSRPESEFKKIYRDAKRNLNGWKAIFLPWHTRPSRTVEWYEKQRKDFMSRTGSLDGLHEQYPSTDVEALAPNTLDKRIPAQWILQCYDEIAGGMPDGCPSIPGLEVYSEPEIGGEYVIGADTAEGNPTSDDSAAHVLRRSDGKQMALLRGKIEPSTFGSYISQLSEYYNNANAMVERNNHGHAVIMWISDNSSVGLLFGHDGKVGWLSNSKGKSLLYDKCADYFRDKETILHSFDTYNQLASINGSTLRAPDNQHDDLADAYALALSGLEQKADTKIYIVGQGYV